MSIRDYPGCLLWQCCRHPQRIRHRTIGAIGVSYIVSGASDIVVERQYLHRWLHQHSQESVHRFPVFRCDDSELTVAGGTPYAARTYSALVVISGNKRGSFGFLCAENSAVVARKRSRVPPSSFSHSFEIRVRKASFRTYWWLLRSYVCCSHCSDCFWLLFGYGLKMRSLVVMICPV